MDKFRMEMQKKVNIYLDTMQKSGAINMFGAAPYISEVFGVNKQEARQYLKNWMDTYQDRHPL
jgi:hypothetical protein